MGLPQGQQIGQVLGTLFEEVIDNPSLNDREYLLKRAKEIIAQ